MTIIELLESHGLEGERLIEGVMKATSCSRGEAITQIRWAHGETHGDQRVVAEAQPSA